MKIKKLVAIILLLVTLPVGNVQAASKKAVLSDVSFYYYGYRLPYTLECDGKYYVRADRFCRTTLADMGGFSAYESDAEFVFYSQQIFEWTDMYMQGGKYYNVAWETPIEVGTSIGTVKKCKSASGYLLLDWTVETGRQKKSVQIYTIANAPYVRIDSLDNEGNNELKFDKKRNAYYIGPKPSGKLHKDVVYPHLVKAIKGCSTKKAKLKAIHDYVAKLITYRGPNEHTRDAALVIDRNYDVAIQTLKDGFGACGDYSALFCEMCDRLFIPCDVIEAGSYHGWNYVYYNGGWWHVDVTWDDTKSNIPKHTHFLETNSEFIKSHNNNITTLHYSSPARCIANIGEGK